MLCADNQLLGRVVVSLITALEQTREFLCKANGAILYHVLVFHSVKPLLYCR